MCFYFILKYLYYNDSEVIALNFFPLSIKTNYHILSSLIDIEGLVRQCKVYQLDTIAVTDPDLFYVMDFYKVCQKNQIHPIIGTEIQWNQSTFYLYAMDYEGYQNLTRIMYEKEQGLLSIDVLAKYKDHLLCILPFSARERYEELRRIYTYFYLGYQSMDERDILKAKLEKMVYIKDSLFLLKEEAVYLNYLYLIRDNKKRDEISTYKVENNSHLLSASELKQMIHPDDLKNMKEIKELCHIQFKNNPELLPTYRDEKEFDARLYLRNLSLKGLGKRLNGEPEKKYLDRLQYELDVIDKMGFNNYFLVVFDFVQYAKKNGIVVGPGRGSASGSLVSYVLGITDVDPLKYDLLFERFLNPERITMPDIDIDFESKRREEVVRYVISKYGKDRVAPIITFVTLGAKQVLRDLGRIFDADSRLIDQACKMIDVNFNLKENIKNKELNDFIRSNKLLIDLYRIGMKLEGCKRQISTHAAGVIISSKPLYHYIPLHLYEDYFITGYAMEHLEELGLLKIDFLGLQNLTLVEHVVKRIKEKDPSFEWNLIPLDDPKTLELFSLAKTNGIFQFESSGMKNFLKRLKPQSFEDIVAAIALFRPGPMANIDTFIKRKEGKQKENQTTPLLEPILRSTYGVIVYQEQIMQIARTMAGYSLGEADILRRAMSKKNRELLEQEEERFIKGSTKNGHRQEEAKEVYDLILAFADYGFNRAHSVAYSILGYKMAYLKAHYRNIFMSNLLSNVIGNRIKIKEYIDEARTLGINILKPDINQSNLRFTEEFEDIRFSLSAISNVGTIVGQTIINERMNGVYIDFFDFVSRVYGRAVNRKTIESLIDADALSCFGHNHQTLLYHVDAAINYAEITKTIDAVFVEKPVIESLPELKRDELLKREIAAIGFYLSTHPATNYALQYPDIVYSMDLPNYFDKMIRMVLYVEKKRVIETKKKEPMMFITASDEYGSIEAVLFPKVFQTFKEVSTGDLLYVTGKVEKRMSNYQLNVSNFQIIDKI